MHVTAELVSATTAELPWVPRPAWLENSELQVALRCAKLVRIASPFPPRGGNQVQDELIHCVPEQLWNLHRGAAEGFQYSHHNLYLDHAELQPHANLSPCLHLAAIRIARMV